MMRWVDFIAAISKHQRISVAPVVAETLAALHAIIFCYENQFQKVVFEGDALQVVQGVNSNGLCSSSFRHQELAFANGVYTVYSCMLISQWGSS